MPGWSPRWDDVAVDVAAVQHAARVVRTAAADLERYRAALAWRVAQAEPQWRGPEPAAILEALRGCASDARTERDRLSDVAHRLDALAGEAIAEQARREADRLRWHTEAAAERRAAEERVAAATRAGVTVDA